MRRACRERGVAAPAPELWACALRSGGERAPLHFYFPVADHVENNNSLGPGQRQLVLLGVPSAAAASSARGFRARVHPQQCALARVRARCAAQRQPAPRRSSAEGHRGHARRGCQIAWSYGSCEQPRGCWKLSPEPLEEQQMQSYSCPAWLDIPAILTRGALGTVSRCGEERTLHMAVSRRRCQLVAQGSACLGRRMECWDYKAFITKLGLCCTEDGSIPGSHE
nr:uncharacterized protein LOC121828200 isoform X2 [Peromyscus maniculatus bairdii]